MPTYEFHCEKCAKNFEQVWALSDYDRRIKEKKNVRPVAALESPRRFPRSK